MSGTLACLFVVYRVMGALRAVPPVADRMQHQDRGCNSERQLRPETTAPAAAVTEAGANLWTREGVKFQRRSQAGVDARVSAW